MIKNAKQGDEATCPSCLRLMIFQKVNFNGRIISAWVCEKCRGFCLEGSSTIIGMVGYGQERT